MIEVKKKAYKKACTELNEIFKSIPENELNKIPKSFIANVQKEMDMDYEFKLESGKNLLEQNLMVETKALIVQIYEKYLAPSSEKEMWNKYDVYCRREIEKQRLEKYNPDDVFKNKKTNIEPVIEPKALIEIKEENIFIRIINWIKNIFR